jgi:hypothetical protein
VFAALAVSRWLEAPSTAATDLRTGMAQLGRPLCLWMVRRSSTVRFCKEAPVQEINSNALNFIGSHSGSQVVRTSGNISTAWAWSAFSALGPDHLGTVGSFSAEAEFRDLTIRLRRLEQSGPPFATCRPTSRGSSWPPRSPTSRSPRRTDPLSATPTPPKPPTQRRGCLGSGGLPRHRAAPRHWGTSQC